MQKGGLVTAREAGQIERARPWTLRVAGVCLALLAAGCAGDGEPGVEVGPVVTRQFDLDGFERIEVTSAFVVEIIQADDHRVTVDAAENLLDEVQVTQRGHTLVLGYGPPQREGTLEATIALPDLKALSLTEASRAAVSGFRSEGEISIVLRAASSVSGDLVADELRIEASEASRAELTGSARDVSVRGSDASQLSLRGFEAEVAEVNLGSASTLSLTVREELRSAVVSDASVLRYYGEPRLGEITTSGAGRVEPGAA